MPLRKCGAQSCVRSKVIRHIAGLEAPGSHDADASTVRQNPGVLRARGFRHHRWPKVEDGAMSRGPDMRVCQRPGRSLMRASLRPPTMVKAVSYPSMRNVSADQTSFPVATFKPKLPV